MEVKVWDERKLKVENERENLDGEEFCLPIEELKKRADDFIARVNRQRMLEARLLLVGDQDNQHCYRLNNLRMLEDTNFWGSVYTTRFALPHQRDSGGKIIVLATLASWLPAPGTSIYNASKAALLILFETLRIELGSDVHILIVTPGFIESEATQGKFPTPEGRVDVDEDWRDVQMSVIPVETVSGCAKAIVNSACRGDKCLAEPAWFRVTCILHMNIRRRGTRLALVALREDHLLAVASKASRCWELSMCSGVSKIEYGKRIVDKEIEHFGHNENVSGKVVLITGAASGIGEQISYEYAKRGACLVLVDIKEDRLGAVVEKARNLGSPDVIAVGADVSKVEDSERFVRVAVDHFGRLDHLVNNAGIIVSGQLKDTKNLLPRRVMDVNFWGTIYSTHFALPHLTKSKGKIIVIASTLGWYPAPKLGFYVASKAAVINFYESLRSEIGGDVGITIVTPGLIKSEMTDNLAKKEKVDLIIPLESKEACAKAIVKSGCRGDKYLVEPSWIRVLYPCKVLYPEHLAYEYATRGARLALVARREDRLRNVAAMAEEIGFPDAIIIAIIIPGDV
ncbi:hypothetical protein GH714_000706 [Hevea brasiliensis]|uniref:Uncharacterized protein n=1 Tax=Hevea brasiliensis TaxID=3981 RepID=A0A6A6LNQ1_HEVBR|nr:hypothetical protein GH714_000706 [Hevea brasiliensis]